MKIVNATKDNAELAGRVMEADTFFRRLKGLLGTSGLPAGTALVIRPCNSVHTFGMAYSIDVIFADSGNKVVKIVSDLPPGRVTGCLAGRYAVELPAGTARQSKTAVGDRLTFIR